MPEKHHLPAAVGLSDLSALTSTEANSLSSMADECARWLRNTTECHASIVTPAAKTLWAALVQDEIDEVAMTHRRLLDAMERRRSFDA